MRGEFQTDEDAYLALLEFQSYCSDLGVDISGISQMSPSQVGTMLKTRLIQTVIDPYWIDPAMLEL